MKYQLEVFTGDVLIVTVDLAAGRNVLSADSTHRYVLRADSDEPRLAGDPAVVQIIRQADDLVIEGLPDQQSLQITEYFTRCSGDQCSMQFASDDESDPTILTPADARWVHASSEGVALTLSGSLQPLTPAQLAVAPNESGSRASISEPALASASTVGVDDSDSDTGSGHRSAVSERASAELAGRESASDEGSGIGAGTILGGALGVAALAGLAGGGGDDTATGPDNQTRPVISSFRAEGADQQVSSEEVRSDGAWQVSGSATDSAQVEISIRVSNSSGTQADLVRTDQFAVDSAGNWSAAYATNFFSGTQVGQITLTIVPIGNDGTRGSSTTQTYGFDGLTTAGPGNPADPVVLTSSDLLELNASILTEEASRTDTPYGVEEPARVDGAAPPASLLQDEVRLSEL